MSPEQVSGRPFLRDLAGFEAAAQHAISLNPRSTATVAFMGMLISWSGDYERGNRLSVQAGSINPDSERESR